MDSAFDSLSIGTKIELMRIEDNTGKSYPSQVLDIINPDELMISGPIKKSNIVLIHRGEDVEISYYVENKGKLYFIGRVISRNYSSVYTIRVKKISEIRKIQQREFFRLPTTLRVDIEHATTSKDNIEAINDVCEAKDISGGGMKIYCNYKFKIGDKILCSFTINNKLIKVNALVARIEEIETFNYKYSLGISFSDMKEDDRDEVIKYVFEQQRILRIKGLI